MAELRIRITDLTESWVDTEGKTIYAGIDGGPIDVNGVIYETGPSPLNPNWHGVVFLPASVGDVLTITFPESFEGKCFGRRGAFFGIKDYVFFQRAGGQTDRVARVKIAEDITYWRNAHYKPAEVTLWKGEISPAVVGTVALVVADVVLLGAYVGSKFFGLELPHLPR